MVGSAKYPGTKGLALPGLFHVVPATGDGVYSRRGVCENMAETPNNHNAKTMMCFILQKEQMIVSNFVAKLQKSFYLTKES